MIGFITHFVDSLYKEYNIKKKLKKATYYEQVGELNNAIVSLKEIFTLKPDAPIAHEYLAKIYRKLQQHDNSVSSYESAIVGYLRVGDNKKVLELYEEFTAAYPKINLQGQLLWKIASIYENFSMYNKAVKLYELIIKDFPFTDFLDTALYNLAELKLRIFDQKAEAFSLYKQIIERYPHSQWYQKAQMQIKQLQIYSPT